jgi:mono/diheme cytochrome c family protein
MSRNEIILGAVALVLVVFSLVVSMVIPRRRPDFPGNRLGLFALVSVLLVAATLTTVEIFGVEEGQGEAHNEGEVTEVQDSGEPDAEGSTTTGADTETGGEGGGGGAAAGEEIFAASGCANCHTLEAAGAQGTVGPNLDEANVTVEAAAEQIENGGNGMPAYGDQLSEDEIQAVAAFVSESGGG